MTYDEFTKATGREPINDDLERANCAKAGQAGHHCCGICGVCFLPRFECKCQKLKNHHVYVNPFAKNNPFRVATTCRIKEINGDIFYVQDLAETKPIFTVIRGEFKIH